MVHHRLLENAWLPAYCLHCRRLQSTVLKEVWPRLCQLAHEASNDEDSDPAVACLNRRILSSLKPDKTMVFVLDLMRPGWSPTQHVVPSRGCSHIAKCRV